MIGYRVRFDNGEEKVLVPVEDFRFEVVDLGVDFYQGFKFENVILCGIVRNFEKCFDM